MQLSSHGDIDSRKIILNITEETLKYLDAYERIRSIASYDGKILKIGQRSWDLTKKKNVYLIGAGKACNAMAMAIDEILGDRLTPRHCQSSRCLRIRTCSIKRKSMSAVIPSLIRMDITPVRKPFKW